MGGIANRLEAGKELPAQTAATRHEGNRQASRNDGLTSGSMGLLTGPHQISFSDVGSLTTRLSSGDRPVFLPEYAVRAPVDVMAVPDSYTRASS